MRRRRRRLNEPRQQRSRASFPIPARARLCASARASRRTRSSPDTDAPGRPRPRLHETSSEPRGRVRPASTNGRHCQRLLIERTRLLPPAGSSSSATRSCSCSPTSIFIWIPRPSVARLAGTTPCAGCQARTRGLARGDGRDTRGRGSNPGLVLAHVGVSRFRQRAGRGCRTRRICAPTARRRAPRACSARAFGVARRRRAW